MEHLFDSSLFFLELIPIVLDPFAPLPDFSPAADVLFGELQLRLAGFPTLHLDITKYLLDQPLAIGDGGRPSICILDLALAVDGALLSFLHMGAGLHWISAPTLRKCSVPEKEFLRSSFRVRVLRVCRLAVGVTCLRFLFLFFALLGAALAGR